MALFNRRAASASTLPKLPFFLLRVIQLVCSAIIFGILGYFIWNLWKDGYRTPYEFSLLVFAASATVLNLLITSILLCCCGLSPFPVLVFDTFLLLLWTISFGLLLRAMGDTTTATCSTDDWGNADGVAVCHMFKCLVAFSLIVLVATLGIVVTAAVARKRQPKIKYTPTLNPANVNTAYSAATQPQMHMNPPQPPPPYQANKVQQPPVAGHGANVSYYG
ncbi:hypothetical protein FN846DRAFT_613297 [Sphaerosporella brunnea]|uniref:MARVEL domain-containing protein n=1 Tax=Sphaerosporella brunnea TaxID=1250544 RepID=A0A5J5ECQ8_9PEZI|nr:hypothetical protein FN846DRAFT_613297 [Sphaerosporella brunnea]